MTILGEYPCCGKEFEMEAPGQRGSYHADNCPECNARIWYFSDLVGTTIWTEENFLKMHEINKYGVIRKLND